MSKFKINLLLILSALSTDCFGMQAARQRGPALARGGGGALARGPKKMPKAPKRPLSMTVGTPKMPTGGTRGMGTMGGPSRALGAQRMLGVAGTSPLQQRMQMEGQFGGAPARGMATDVGSLKDAIQNGRVRGRDLELLLNELDPNFVDEQGNTVLHNFDVLRDLTVNDFDRRTLEEADLFSRNAIEKKDEKRTALLNKLTSETINAQNAEGVTPLMMALRRNSVETIRWLLDAGADPNIKDLKGKTLLMEAIKKVLQVEDISVDTELVKELLESKKVDLSLQDNDGNTAAMLALEKPRVLEMLIDKGANLNPTNTSGETILDMAHATLPTWDDIAGFDRSKLGDELKKIKVKKSVIDLLGRKGAGRKQDISKLDQLREKVLFYLVENPDKIKQLEQALKEAKSEKYSFHRGAAALISGLISAGLLLVVTDDQEKQAQDLVSVPQITPAELRDVKKTIAEVEGSQALEQFKEHVKQVVQEHQAGEALEKTPGQQPDMEEEVPAQGPGIVEEVVDVPAITATAETPAQAVGQQVEAVEDIGLTPSKFGQWAAWATGNERLKDPAVQQQVWDEAKAKTYETLVSSPYRKARSWAGYDK